MTHDAGFIHRIMMCDAGGVFTLLWYIYISVRWVCIKDVYQCVTDIDGVSQKEEVMAIDLLLPTFAVWQHWHKYTRSRRESRRNVQPETAVNLIHPGGVAYWHMCGHHW